MKRILVNGTQQEELRVAIVDGQKLYNLDIEAATKRQKKGNIYKGVIASIAPSLNAVFVDYGGTRQGFLPTKEICPRYFTADFEGPIRKQVVHKLVEEGQEIIVQIVREEISNKGASLSTYISLSGLYMVLLPDKPRTHGISQRISGTDRQRMLDISRQLVTEKNEGLILRTACLNAEKKDLQKNLDYLRYLWKQIRKTSNQRPAPFLIYKEANIVLQAIQNNLGSNIDEIIIDNQEIYEETREFVSMVLPRYKKKLKLYSGDIPLFNRMHIETQIETLYQREIELPSGGAIVFDHTEALTSIDINSARSTRQQDLEATALKTNLEAAEEIARQLRLRDLGGLLVIDFIDMKPHQNRRKVEERLRGLLRTDRARTRQGRISDFGLLEMSRQRLRPSLQNESEIICPRCYGRGFIRTVKSCALVVLRLVEGEAGKPQTSHIVSQVPVEVNQFLIGEKSTELKEIEKRYDVKVTINSDSQIETPHYKIMRYKENNGVGYNNEPASIRSSFHENNLFEKQSQTDKALEKETAAIPTVIAMEKATLSEMFGSWWKKLTSLFVPKDTPNKQRRTKYRKQNRRFDGKSRSSTTNQSQYQKTQTRHASKKRSGYKKPVQTETDTYSKQSSTRQQNFRDKTKPSSSQEKYEQRRRPRMHYKNNRNQATSSERRNYTSKDSIEKTPRQTSTRSDRNTRYSDKSQTVKTASDFIKETSLSTPHYGDRDTQPSDKPQTIKKAFKLDNMFKPKPPQIKGEKSKLIQIETKTQTKTSDNSK